MTSAVLTPTGRMPAIDGWIVAGLVLAAAIAAFQPFDLAFGAVTLGLPWLRAVTIVALALVGGWAGRRVGLHVELKGGREGLAFPVLVASAVALGCAAMDRLFSPVLPTSYVRLMTTVPLGLRMAAFMLRAFNENIIYRLFLGSVLAWAFGRVWKAADGRPAQGAFWLAFAVAQALNVWINVTSLAPLSALGVLHDALRYFAPGMVWSWLYRRRGFQANEIASTSVHLFFQPLVGLLLTT